MPRVKVEENSFIWDTDHPDITQTGSQPEALIKINDASVAVLRNYINGEDYRSGITVAGGSNVNSNSLLCDNLIQASNGTPNQYSGVGISTSRWEGYGKMNRVFDYKIGHESGFNDLGAIVFSRYTGSFLGGLTLTDGSSSIDMRGVHTSSGGYGAFDTLDHNCVQPGSSNAEIELNGSTLLLGTSSQNASTFGQNTIIGFGNSSLIENYGALVSIDINENYWGWGAWGSLTRVQPTGTTNVYLSNVTFNLNPLSASNPIGRPFSVSCGTGFEPSTAPIAVKQESREDFTCEDWFVYGFDLKNAKRYQELFDTMTAYIYSCHTPWVKPGFALLNSAVQYMSLDNTRWKDYREWLKTVLYLNQVDDSYYCDAIAGFMSTFQYMDPERGIDYNGEISMIDYVLSTGKCLEDSTFFRNARRDLRVNQVSDYWDTVQNPTETPLDTTLVPLHEIGLEILYGPSVVKSASPTSSQILSGLSSNPTMGTTELSMELTHGTSLSIGVYDLLGNQHLDLGMRWFEAGPHSIPIDVSDLASGVYYMRLATSLGQVKTLKLVKQ